MNQNHGSHHEVLHRVLDQRIIRSGLTELHTHLMGMGSADFWVSRIMKVFLTNYSAEHPSRKEIYYSLSTILEADGVDLGGNGHLRMNTWNWKAKMECAKLEARMFDGLSGNMLNDFPYIDEHFGHAISNTRLMELLKEEKDGGQLRGLIRNWFEFLDSAGNPVSNVDILDTYRGNFSPLFYPGRFKMKEAIIDQCPIVLGVLLNNVLHRYAIAGVNYVEFSVSWNDLMNDELLHIMRNEVFASVNNYNNHDEDDDNDEDLQIVLDAHYVIEEFDRTGSIPQELQAQKKTKTASKYPSVPKVSNLQHSPSPAWRQYDIQYHRKNNYQSYYFLAAMNRNKDVFLPCIENNQFAYRSNTRMSPIDAYEQLGQLILAPNMKFMVDILAGFQDSIRGLPHAMEIFQDDTAQLRVDEIHANLFAAGGLFSYVKVLAEYLCSDDAVQSMFRNMFNAQTKLGGNIEKMRNNVAEYAQSIVGFDWVGDELGYPYCALSHDMFIDIIKEFRKHNPRFGVRLHAGEGVMRPATIDDSPDVKVAFALHMCILCETIKSLCDKLQGPSFIRSKGSPKPLSDIRIGHGVAFLYGHDEVTYTTKPNPHHNLLTFLETYTPIDSGIENARNEPFMFELKKYLAKFRKDYLIDKHIVTELNPTSNHLLLSDTFTHGDLGNNRTLFAFIKQKLPVVLCTDDDGIWAIHKCAQHHNHISVAHEYCQAIHNGEIETVEQLKQMFDDGRDSAFAPV